MAGILGVDTRLDRVPSRLQSCRDLIQISELARRGLLDLAKLRAAAAGTPVASAL